MKLSTLNGAVICIVVDFVYDIICTAIVCVGVDILFGVPSNEIETTPCFVPTRLGC